MKKTIIILLTILLNLSCSINKTLAQDNGNINKVFKKELNILVDYLDLINKNVKFFDGGYKYIEVNTNSNGIIFLSPYSAVEIKDYITYFKYKGYYFFSDNNNKARFKSQMQLLVKQ